MNDRIKLAEAMGYKPYPDADTPCWWSPDGLTIHPLTDEFPHLPPLPDPEHDANDDYAVLEWMREKGLQDANTWTKFVDTLNDFPEMGLKVAYQIGDYARAALRAIDD